MAESTKSAAPPPAPGQGQNRPLDPEQLDPVELESGIAHVQQVFTSALSLPSVHDLAFVGNTSDCYPWDPAVVLDIDLCLFVSQHGLELGRWLLETKQQLQQDLVKRGLDFELRVIRGPYKPLPRPGHPPLAFAHVALLDEASYARAPATLRYSWRKYRCVLDPDRLARLAPPRLEAREVLELARHKLQRLQGDAIHMTEWQLPSLHTVQIEVRAGEPLYAEYCFAAALATARSHARSLGDPEPDSLTNGPFVIWYCDKVLRSGALIRLMRLKEAIRQGSSAQPAAAEARVQAVDYLQRVSSELDRVAAGSRSSRIDSKRCEEEPG